jgi:hypothetical protein
MSTVDLVPTFCTLDADYEPTCQALVFDWEHDSAREPFDIALVPIADPRPSLGHPIQSLNRSAAGFCPRTVDDVCLKYVLYYHFGLIDVDGAVYTSPTDRD